MKINVIGAGLAGVEACYQLLKRGYDVTLYEMRPKKMTPAHKTDLFAELICSNSLRSNDMMNAVGLLKEEMRKIGSIVMEAAEKTRVEAGSALAVDRTLFSEYITNKLKSFPNLEIIYEEVKKIPEGPCIICSGPLTSDDLHHSIEELVGEHLYFFDAVAPIIDATTIDYDKVFLESRYDKGEAAYLNAPFTKEEFEKFYDYLIHAESVESKDFEMKVFEGCMPIEEMAKRGIKTLLFGPMKPVGLTDPKTGRRPYAVVQLRRDDAKGEMYNIVGFQTHLKFPAQKELMKYIPGLENAKIIRYGVMHRNTYMNSPKLLDAGFRLKKHHDLFFAGQMTGVEGYVESAASGIIAGINMTRVLEGKELLHLNSQTSIGALSCYVANPAIEKFVPMNVNFGLFDPIDANKKNRKEELVKRSINEFDKLLNEIGDSIEEKEGCQEEC